MATMAIGNANPAFEHRKYLVISVIYLCLFCTLKTFWDIFLKLNLLTELWHLLDVSAVVGHVEMSAALLLDI